MNFLYYFLSFFLVINVIVFVHEYGHYLAAKKVGVKVVKFSIGIGSEIFGWTDKNGTRWCFSIFPIGGFVMMLGDGDISSATTDEESISALPEEERKMSVTNKSNWEKMLISFSGPFFNYIYAFLMLVAMSCFYGAPKYDTRVGEILSGSAAELSGIKKGDVILSLNGTKVEKYPDVIKILSESNDEKFNFIVERNGEMRTIEVVPTILEKRKLFGGIRKIKQVGIKAGAPTFEKKTFLDSVGFAFDRCISSTKEMFLMLSKLFGGKKSLDDFGSVVHMASVAGELTKSGNFALLILFTITLSLNLGFINLLPLPVLDGGNILMCFIEQVLGRKINKKIQESIMMICATLLILLMIIMVANDIFRFDAVNKFISNLLG